jgi:hypothetical protein
MMPVDLDRVVTPLFHEEEHVADGVLVLHDQHVVGDL